MKVGQSVRFGAGLIIGLNLIMAFGSIWIFVRMAPAIETIIERNERSLYACEQMLTYLAASLSTSEDAEKLQDSFVRAMDKAERNITESEEPLAIEIIKKNYHLAFRGDPAARTKTLMAIGQLSEINRNAMVRADHKARQLGYSGAWGIVFMASAIFLLGLHFLRLIQRTLIRPIEELNSVIIAYHNGDRVRRCRKATAPQDFRTLLEGLNNILDDTVSKSQVNTTAFTTSVSSQQ